MVDVSNIPTAFYNYKHQYTVLRTLYILTFYYTISITHFTRQMIQFYVSHRRKHNLHVTTFETNDLILISLGHANQN